MGGEDLAAGGVESAANAAQARPVVADIRILYPSYELFLSWGVPDHIRYDHGSEFSANVVRSWLKDPGVTTLYIEPGSPWENGYVESYVGKPRDELLHGEILDT